MIGKIERINYLIDYLNKATKEYDKGIPIISDKEWDDLYFELRDLEDETGYISALSPTQKVQFEQVSKLKKVKHTHLMLSLEKTKDVNVIKSFVGDRDFLAMGKMDGLTVSIKYVQGKLVSAETRGNGEIGEDILHNAKFVKGIPSKIKFKDDLIIDGEIICTYNDFEEFKRKYKNPRNFAAGSIRLLDNKESSKRKLTFVAWDVIRGFNNYLLLSEKLTKLKDYGFNIVPYVENNINPDLVKDMCNLHGYPMDGVVYKFDDIIYRESLGRTDHHFNGAIAYKFYEESVTSYLQNIEWSMGRTGVLTPVAVFDEVELLGTMISRASLHNVDILKKTLNVPYYDQEVEIYKSNEIIPQIRAAAAYDEKRQAIAMPTVCPICKEKIKEIDGNLVCLNPKCPGKSVNILDHFCSKKGLDIKGFSKITLEKLVDWGIVNNFEDIIRLKEHKKELIYKPGFGEASVNKLIENIKTAITNVPLWRVISAAGIPQIGVTASKNLADYCKTWENFRKMVNDNVDFSCITDFGDVMNKNIHEYNYIDIDNAVKYIPDIQEVTEAAAQSSSSLEGKVFVITGKLTSYKNRDELKAKIEELGGKVTGSVSSKTDYLINNDIDSSSSKNVTAKKLNIPIITEQEFNDMIY